MTAAVVVVAAMVAASAILLAAAVWRDTSLRMDAALAILDEPDEPPEDRADGEADTIAVLRAIERGDLAGAVGVVDRTRTPRQLAAHLTGVTAAAIDALSCLGYRVDTTRWAARAALRDLEELP